MHNYGMVDRIYATVEHFPLPTRYNNRENVLQSVLRTPHSLFRTPISHPEIYISSLLNFPSTKAYML